MDNRQNTKVKPSSERGFGIVFSIFFFIIGIYTYFNGNNFSLYFFLVSIVFLIFAIFFSKYLRTLNILWFKFGILLNSIISPFVMLLIFFCVFLPIGIIMKFIKKDLINIKSDKMLNSYWQNKEDNENNMKKQF